MLRIRLITFSNSTGLSVDLCIGIPSRRSACFLVVLSTCVPQNPIHLNGDTESRRDGSCVTDELKVLSYCRPVSTKCYIGSLATRSGGSDAT